MFVDDVYWDFRNLFILLIQIWMMAQSMTALQIQSYVKDVNCLPVLMTYEHVC